jgi:DNA-binding NarL/FixJ family response regulator
LKALVPFAHIAREIRVVLVDDHRALLDGLCGYFEDIADIAVVSTACSGPAALDLVAELQPDVLLLDLGLPDMSGLEVARQVRRDWPAVAILALTARDEEYDRHLLLRLGARGYLSKTVSCEVIVDALRVVAAGGTLLDTLAAPSVRNIPDHLSLREQEVLELVLLGSRNRDIAATLGISVHTVEFHLSQLFAKFGVHSHWELIARVAKYTPGYVWTLLRECFGTGSTQHLGKIPRQN